MDLVPRREFSMVDPDEVSVTELYRLVSDAVVVVVVVAPPPVTSSRHFP